MADLLVPCGAAPAHADGRFAPSPTGTLHLGNLRTALLAWLFARAADARFLVRIEDLDSGRVRASFVAEQLADLAALGLDHDDEIVRQSERTSRYEAALERLRDAGLVYPCWCTRAEIRDAASAPHDGLPDGAYPGTCRDLPAAEAERRAASGRPPALRVRAAGAVERFTDRLCGPVSGAVDDFVIRRNDGAFAYNLAVVVDDGDQGIGEVVRGADLLDSTPRQRWLQRRLGLPHPGYAHVPLLLGEGGRRLAKRDGAITLAERRALGQTAAQLRGELAASVGLARAGEAPALGDLVARTRDLLHSGVPA
ncbi:MAG TPA: tRNA glutamyl-Q(34) synthetase GluQRS [Solirubrobacteraceae bacterium]|nr:tRNA glutamyl-Q(34) synthetase GluQRS [Solirubrobacteraceae bacterium]